MRIHRRAVEAFVRREGRASARHRADADAEAAVSVVEDRRLDDRAVRLVEIELPERRPRAAVGERAVVVDSGGAARLAAVIRDEHLMAAAAALEGVRSHEDLIRLAACEPRPVAVVTIGVPLRPRLPTVSRREERVVDEVDARVVHAAARVLRQVRIAEARVDGRARRARRAEVPVAVPVRAAVRRRPHVHLVAVVRDEAEIAPRRAHDPVPVQVGRALVRAVDQRAVQCVGEDLRLAARELLIDVDRRGEGRRRRAGSARSRQCSGECEQRPEQKPRAGPAKCDEHEPPPGSVPRRSEYPGRRKKRQGRPDGRGAAVPSRARNRRDRIDFLMDR